MKLGGADPCQKSLDPQRAFRGLQADVVSLLDLQPFEDGDALLGQAGIDFVLQHRCRWLKRTEKWAFAVLKFSIRSEGLLKASASHSFLFRSFYARRS
jgi:hypothetical protein